MAALPSWVLPSSSVAGAVLVLLRRLCNQYGCGAKTVVTGPGKVEEENLDLEGLATLGSFTPSSILSCSAENFVVQGTFSEAYQVRGMARGRGGDTDGDLDGATQWQGGRVDAARHGSRSRWMFEFGLTHSLNSAFFVEPCTIIAYHHIRYRRW